VEEEEPSGSHGLPARLIATSPTIDLSKASSSTVNLAISLPAKSKGKHKKERSGRKSNAGLDASHKERKSSSSLEKEKERSSQQSSEKERRNSSSKQKKEEKEEKEEKEVKHAAPATESSSAIPRSRSRSIPDDFVLRSSKSESDKDTPKPSFPMKIDKVEKKGDSDSALTSPKTKFNTDEQLRKDLSMSTPFPFNSEGNMRTSMHSSDFTDFPPTQMSKTKKQAQFIYSSDDDVPSTSPYVDPDDDKASSIKIGEPAPITANELKTFKSMSQRNLLKKKSSRMIKVEMEKEGKSDKTIEAVFHPTPPSKLNDDVYGFSEFSSSESDKEMESESDSVTVIEGGVERRLTVKARNISSQEGSISSGDKTDAPAPASPLASPKASSPRSYGFNDLEESDSDASVKSDKEEKESLATKSKKSRRKGKGKGKDPTKTSSPRRSDGSKQDKNNAIPKGNFLPDLN